jgi:chemotaxis protein MotB
MAEDSKSAPIIVINKKVVHGGHHGGAWKVAFADFVTAMMALFIVLWLLNTSQNVKDSIAGYFKDPTGNGRMVGSALAGSGDALQVKKEDLKDLKTTLEAAIKEVPEFKALQEQVQITVTGEGLRIELMESDKASFFESGNARPSDVGQDFLVKLASEIGKLNNFVTIEGHTDAKPFSNEKSYSNWELSADRANSARRLMQTAGLREDQVKQIRGFGSQRLRKLDDPDDPSNRRISIIVQYEAQVREEDKSILQKQHEKEMKVQAGEHGEKGGHGDAKPSEGNAKEAPKPESKPEAKSEKGHEPEKPAAKAEEHKPATAHEGKTEEPKKKH